MDPEIEAMGKVAAAMGELNPEARMRILRWAADKYGVEIKKPKPNNPSADGDLSDIDSGEDVDDVEKHETFAEFFSEASPSTPAEKILVAGYWHQEMLGRPDVNSAALNKDLKDLGHGITNPNQKFDTLLGTKPQLAIQLKKSGSSRQARKKYKITKAGIEKVKKMLGS
ncbi:MAG: hypothetical protein V7667_03760 [Alloalcanivorax venustensis]|mgnify:CR=1 FL=1|jgi:hypothetical protein|uniref:hypothetical protein n=1 Tax=Alloalcanivorax venustensis TaxID=172371 RepID=UPI002EA1724B|nr:hypothetical protein [Pseudomonadota bacterium]|tara:strand:+ start:304 stop:810 length:507 start_codon:yes stop_codon:yes gene_type:complete